MPKNVFFAVFSKKEIPSGPINLVKIILKFIILDYIVVLVAFTVLLFDTGVCLAFNKGNEVRLDRNQKSTAKNQI